ncbi:MAG: hypothetical protein WAU60_15970 [Candidatus Competibacter denitrificans]
MPLTNIKVGDILIEEQQRPRWALLSNRLYRRTVIKATPKLIYVGGVPKPFYRRTGAMRGSSVCRRLVPVGAERYQQLLAAEKEREILKQLMDEFEIDRYRILLPTATREQIAFELHRHD